VLDYYTGKDCSAAQRENIKYIIVGPREKALSGASTACLPTSVPIFESSTGDIAIYAAPDR
jgi:hypothetical protein